MTARSEAPPHGSTDAVGLALACVGAMAAALALVALGSDAFEAVLGITSPLGPLLVVVGLGYCGWLILSRRGWIPSGAPGADGYRPAVLIGLALPLIVIAVDWLGGFSRDINVPPPASLLFYPSIAVVAELVFHVAPLAVGVMLASVFRNGVRGLELAGLGTAVTIEPALQVIWGRDLSPGWANACVGVQLLAFNIIGVYLLRRFGILRVLAYRMSYYLVWHILWGYARVNLLFAA